MTRRTTFLFYLAGVMAAADIAVHAFAPQGGAPPATASKDIFVPAGTAAAYDTVHYAPVVRVGDLVIVSGVAAAGSGTVDEQLRRMFDRIQQNLAAAGATVDDVIELQSFHRPAADTAAFQAEFRQVRMIHDEFFKSNYPAWTAVGNAMLLAPNAIAEMRAMAIVGSGLRVAVHRGNAADAQAPAPAAILPPAEHVEVPPAGVALPMVDAGGRPAIDVTIDGKGPFRFVLDTGAALTVLSPDLIGELNLPPIGGNPQAGPVRIGELRADGATLRGLTVGRAPMLGGAGDVPRGVLSASAFPGELVVFDFPRHEIRLRPGALAAADGREIFEYRADEVLPSVPVRIGSQEFRLRLDSGAPGGFTLPLSAMASVPLKAPATEIGRAKTAAGEFALLEAPTSAPVSIGRFAVDVDRLEFSDLRAGPRAAIGLVGSGVLRTFVITLDASDRRIKFERP
jgi:enamine deaminase RidA (YjgF/YER057c/UK114 family)